MLKIYQGDSSDVLTLKGDSRLVLDDNWLAFLVVVFDEDTSQTPIITKRMCKDPENCIFYSMLTPQETSLLEPGKYIIGFQIENPCLNFKKEIHEKMKVLKQVVWKNSTCPPPTTWTIPPSASFGTGVTPCCIELVEGEE